MKIFIDTADVDEIKRFAKLGILDGVTTNPALIAREGRDIKEVLNEIISLVDGPISGEVVSLDAESMIHEGRIIAKLHDNMVVKLPANIAGYEALNHLSAEGIKTNFTLIYTANQALMAAKLGATYVSPFVGRLDVTSTGGSELIREIAKIYNNYEFDTQILAASMRTSVYVKEAALAGAHAATIPPAVLEDMLCSELSDLALTGFLNQWNAMSDDKKTLFDE
ncbi:MAG: transaldolase [Flavobacteriales bacterium]|jgi:transaldolase